MDTAWTEGKGALPREYTPTESRRAGPGRRRKSSETQKGEGAVSREPKVRHFQRRWKSPEDGPTAEVCSLTGARTNSEPGDLLIKGHILQTPCGSRQIAYNIYDHRCLSIKHSIYLKRESEAGQTANPRFRPYPLEPANQFNSNLC